MPAEQQSNISIGGSWRPVDEVFVRVGGAWRRVNQAYVYHSGVWRRWYAYDATAPTVVSFTLNSPTANTIYGPTQTSASYSLVFSEPVTGLTTADFTLTGTSTGWTIGTVTNPSSDQKTYQITISATSPTSGTVSLQLLNNSVSDIIDGAAFNTYTSGPHNSPVFTIDATRPTVSTFLSGSSSTSRTVDFTLTFSESVTGLATTDFSLLGTSTGWTISSVTGSGASYIVRCTETSTGSTIDGTLSLRLAANGVTDAYGNTGPSSAVDATTFTVVRKPPTPSMTALTSTNTSLHNRSLSASMSSPASLTSVDTIAMYFYDSNDTYIANSAQYFYPSPATTAPISRSFTYDVGRNPGTKYYARTQIRNTDGLWSDVSARVEVTTGADQTPPTVATPTIAITSELGDPGYPGRSSNSRSLRIDWSYAGLTDEVGSITVYLASSSWTINKPGGGWGTLSTDSRTASGLTWGTSYSGFVRSNDIYGGVNSTADSGSASKTTQAAGYTARVDYVQDYTNSPLRRSSGSAYGSPGTSLGAIENIYDGDENTYWVSTTAANGVRLGAVFFGSPSASGAIYERTRLTSIRIRTGKLHDPLYTCLKTWYNPDNPGSPVWQILSVFTTEQYSGQYYISQVRSNGGDQWTTTWTGDYTLATPSNSASEARFELYFTMAGVSYNGSFGITNTNLRAVVREIDFNAQVISYTPAYNW